MKIVKSVYKLRIALDHHSEGNGPAINCEFQSVKIMRVGDCEI